MSKKILGFKNRKMASLSFVTVVACTYYLFNQNSGSLVLSSNKEHSENTKSLVLKSQNASKIFNFQELPFAENEASPFKMNLPIVNQLKNYHQINKKAFLSEHDLEFKSKVLSDENMMLEIKKILLQPSKNFVDTELIQNFALEYLYEAVKGNHQFAQDMLIEIIKDSSIEKKSLSISDRQSMAEIKADVFFNLSAILPDSDQLIEQNLPGPISHKIWTNVKLRQQKYLAESETEMAL